MTKKNAWLNVRYELEKLAYRLKQPDGSIIVSSPLLYGKWVVIPGSEITNYEKWSKAHLKTTKMHAFFAFIVSVAAMYITRFVGVYTGSATAKNSSVFIILLLLILACMIDKRRKIGS